MWVPETSLTLLKSPCTSDSVSRESGPLAKRTWAWAWSAAERALRLEKLVLITQLLGLQASSRSC